MIWLVLSMLVVVVVAAAVLRRVRSVAAPPDEPAVGGGSGSSEAKQRGRSRAAAAAPEESPAGDHPWLLQALSGRAEPVREESADPAEHEPVPVPFREPQPTAEPDGQDPYDLEQDHAADLPEADVETGRQASGEVYDLEADETDEAGEAAEAAVVPAGEDPEDPWAREDPDVAELTDDSVAGGEAYDGYPGQVTEPAPDEVSSDHDVVAEGDDHVTTALPDDDVWNRILGMVRGEHPLPEPEPEVQPEPVPEPEVQLEVDAPVTAEPPVPSDPGDEPPVEPPTDSLLGPDSFSGPVAAARTRRCGYCREAGHDRRSCPRLAETPLT